MKRIMLYALLLVLCGRLAAQTDLNRFDGIKSQGPIPQDVKQTLLELYNQDKQRARDFNDGKLTNRDKVLSASYHINHLMASGRILYGDPISTMLDKVADILLKEYPQLRDELRIYVIKSPEVNAFATGQGMLFVTTGMMAQVENEAQLAFLLSHEIVHYYRKHSWENLTRKEKTKDFDQQQDEELRFIKYHNRSKEMEREADSLGLEMFYVNSPYDKAVCDGFFDVLQYGYLPFDEVKIDTDYFNTPYYKFPAEYFLDSVAPITARDDYDDSKSTHPNLLKRRQSCQRILSAYKGGSPYVVTTKEEFEKLRDLARLECIRQNLIYAEYVRALYDIMVMQQYMPENEYLVKAKAEAYYGMSKFKTYTKTNVLVVGNYRRMEGEAQQAYYFFQKIKNDELNLLAVRELWKAKRQFPEDAVLSRMTEDAVQDLALKHGFDATYFLSASDTSKAEGVQGENAAETQSKYDKIRQKKKLQEKQNLKKFVFADLMQQDADFQPFLKECMKKTEETEKKQAEPEGENMFIYASRYYVADGNELKIKKSDRMDATLVAYLEEVAKKEKMGIVDFSDGALRLMTENQEYNDFVALNEWVNEFWQSRGVFDHVLSQQHQMNDLVERYHANRINLTAVLNLENQNPFEPAYLWGLFLPVVWPFVITELSSGYEQTHLQTVYADASTGRMLSSRSYSYDYADNKNLVKGSIYDNMLRAKGLKDRPYLNSHLLLGVDLLAGINTFVSGETSFGSEKNRASALAVRPQLNLEYLFTNEYALHLTMTGIKTMTETADPADDFFGQHSSQEMDVFTLGAGFRKYRDFTPMGIYYGVDLLWHRCSFPPATSNANAFYDGNQKINHFGLNIETGRNYVCFERLVLHFGMNLGLTFSMPFEEGFSLNEDDPAKRSRRLVGQNIWLQNLFMLKVGVGILPF